MTGREIIEAVQRFENPPRIGMTLPDPYPNDVLHSGRRGGAPNEPLEPRGNESRRWRDEWGVTWASLTDFDKGEVMAGAIGDWAELDDYQPPQLGRIEDYQAAKEKFAADESDRFHIGSIPGFVFNVARKLRKLEDYLCDLVLERSRIDRLHAIVREQLLAAIDCWAEVGAHAIGFAEDWGTQLGLMIHPEMWREIFKPEFKTLAGRAHDHGMRVWMHSCGRITDVIDDMIECGVDAFLFDQPRLHGIDVLGERFGGRATFVCPVDIQKTLQTKDPEQIRADAKQMIEQIGGAGGGFVADYYGGNEAIGLEPEIQDIACKAFVEFGTYSH